MMVTRSSHDGFFATTTEDHDSEKAGLKDQSVQFGECGSELFFKRS